jgi:hypothetical protein
MSTVARQAIGVSTYATRPVTKGPGWHGLVTADVLFNNLSSGLFLAAALAELAVPGVFAAAAKVAYPIAFLLLLADLACLVIDLGDPFRFHHMLRVFKPSSPMSLGTWSLVAFSVPVTLLTIVDRLPAGGTALEWIRRLAAITGILPAFAVATYKGVLFSTSSQPGWKDARWLGAYLANSALVLGCAELLTIAVVAGYESAVPRLSAALALLLAVSLVALFLLVEEVRGELSRYRAPGELGVLAALVAGVGIVLPLLLLSGQADGLRLAAVALVVFGALVARHEVVRLPHRSPRTQIGQNT